MTTRDYNDCVKKYSDDLYRFALRYTGDGDASKDCVQDCFVALWEHRDELAAEGIKGWMMRTLYRRLVDRHRHQLVEREAQANLIEQQKQYDQHHIFELHDAMQQALNQLPDIQRQLVLLKDLEGYSYDEIAQLTGLNEQQVPVYLFRARKKMRELLTPNQKSTI